MTKPDILARLRAAKVIALVRADEPAPLLDCARALAAGGIGALELTMTTPGAVELCAAVTRALPHLLVGLGTVLDEETVPRAVAAGARFIVTPCVRPGVIGAARTENIPVLGGAFTPTEVWASWEAGADVVKIFPAEFFGPSYLRSLKGPFPQVELLPTGGVTPETVAEFLRAGAFATAAGSSLVTPAALKARDWAALTARARQFVAAAG
jgi:2-dehydro-3-deoxyphosphogluconate aldolase/(4S)-4-hydroxy-2-oxoglutarate aldolase